MSPICSSKRVHGGRHRMARLTYLTAVSSCLGMAEAFLPPTASSPAFAVGHRIFTPRDAFGYDFRDTHSSSILRQNYHCPIATSRLCVTSPSAPSSLDTNSIELEETETDTTLDDGSTLLYVVRAKHCETISCQGVLLQPETQDVSNDDRKEAMQAREARLLVSPLVDSDRQLTDDALMEGARRTLDSLLLQHLVLERPPQDEKSKASATIAELIVCIESIEDDIDSTSQLNILQQAVQSRGFVADDDDTFRLAYGKVVRAYTELAMAERRTTVGLMAVEILGLLSSRRIPYKFSDEQVNPRPPSLSTTVRKRDVLAAQRQLLPKSVTDRVLEIMADVEAKGWLSTNLDSVDNIPSLHLNLVSGGEPIFPIDEENDTAASTNDSATFEGSIKQLWLLVKPHLEKTLLPRVRQEMGSSTVELSDVFIRRYGEDVQPDHESATRYGISAHFDVTASTTSVVALDDVAAEGKSGLYTTESNDASNHAALRRYFPLSAGDAVIHTWDILHGVEIEPDQSRTSLIVWFEDLGNTLEGDEERSHTSSHPPWLADPAEDDDIGMFVLATATATDGPTPADDELMRQGGGDDDATHPHTSYIKSAALGNEFALTSVGSLCNEGALSPDHLSKVKSMLEEQYGIPHASRLGRNEMAIELWKQAATHGNSLACSCIADEYMAQSMQLLKNGETRAESNDLRLKAAVLFSLAAQQGYEDALQALLRVLDVESSLHETDEEFYASPVFQIGQVAIMVRTL